jgi:hypothetical protein
VPLDPDALIYVPPGVQLREPIHNQDGVDLTQIRWMLALSPAERLQAHKEFMDSIEELLACAGGWTPRRS